MGGTEQTECVVLGDKHSKSCRHTTQLLLLLLSSAPAATSPCIAAVRRCRCVAMLELKECASPPLSPAAGCVRSMLAESTKAASKTIKTGCCHSNTSHNCSRHGGCKHRTAAAADTHPPLCLKPKKPTRAQNLLHIIGTRVGLATQLSLRGREAPCEQQPTGAAADCDAAAKAPNAPAGQRRSHASCRVSNFNRRTTGEKEGGLQWTHGLSFS